MELSVTAPAKINLTLDVLDKRADGYHNIRSVMQETDLCDEVSVSVNGSGGISVSADLPYIPTDGRNTTYKAVAAFFEAAGIKNPGVSVEIHKRIPVGAGLGGGSADAAAVIKALDKLMDTGYSVSDLADIGGRVGSDVPFCIVGGTAEAEGRGEKLLLLPDAPVFYAVIAKPPFSNRTADIYANLDRERVERRPDTDGMTEAIRKGDRGGIVRRVYNVMEDGLGTRRAAVQALKTALIGAGAETASMSGSGSSVFGLFVEKSSAEQAAEKMASVRADIFVCAFAQRKV